MLHALATLHMKRPEITRLGRSGATSKHAELKTRPIFFLEEDRLLPTRIYDRYALQSGFRGAGPALIGEYGSSTLIGPADTFEIGKLGEIDIACKA